MDKNKRSQNVVRQSWDLRPFAAVPWYLCLYSSYNIQRNYMGLKIAEFRHSWGEFWTKRNKKRKTKMNCLFWRGRSQEMGAKAGQLLCMPPVLNITKRWANHLSHLSSPAPGQAPTLTPYEEWAWPLLRSREENLLFVFTPSCSSPRRDLNSGKFKPCLNFLSGI